MAENIVDDEWSLSGLWSLGDFMLVRSRGRIRTNSLYMLGWADSISGTLDLLLSLIPLEGLSGRVEQIMIQVKVILLRFLRKLSELEWA